MRHMTAPAYDREVIPVSDTLPMRWDRWAEWHRSDPRWSFEVIETDDLSPEDVAAASPEHPIAQTRRSLIAQQPIGTRAPRSKLFCVAKTSSVRTGWTLTTACFHRVSVGSNQFPREARARRPAGSSSTLTGHPLLPAGGSP